MKPFEFFANYYLELKLKKPDIIRFGMRLGVWVVGVPIIIILNSAKNSKK